MPSDHYSESLSVLRTRAVEPSFDEIRDLVLRQPSRRRVVPFWWMISAGLPLLGLLTIVIFPELVGLQRQSASSSVAGTVSPVLEANNSPITPSAAQQSSSQTSRPTITTNRQKSISSIAEPRYFSKVQTTSSVAEVMPQPTV